jgi:hypothetical protein
MPDSERNVQFSIGENVCFEYEIDETLDKSSIYFDKNDYNRVENENQLTLQMMQTGYMDPAYFCSRGLESRTDMGVTRRRDGIRQAQKAVVDEHRRQIDNNCNDPDMIAELYKRFASPALRKARHVATRDARVARK